MGEMLFHNAACHAADIVRHAAAADARLGQIGVVEKAGLAVKALVLTADDLGFIAISKADYDKLIGFVEEVRDCSPDVFSGRAIDPQDDVDDMIAHDVLLSFQTDAETLIGRKPEAQKVAA
jgi:hypothetical protein